MSFPAVYAGHLVDVAARFGVEADELLEPFDLTLEDLRDASTRLEVAQVVELAERARALTGEPGLGVYLGLAMRASWHGYLGFAVLTARDIGDALKLGERFFPTRTDALSGAGERAFIDVGHRDRAALGDELLREAAPDARAGAGDGGDLSLEPWSLHGVAA